VYEVKLMQVLAAVIAAAVPFVTAALKNRLGIGLVGTLVTVVCMRIGGLWFAVPSCIGFTVYILFFMPESREESGTKSVADKSEAR
jgi:predicted anti-sigma-YlaC factor YlaD